MSQTPREPAAAKGDRIAAAHLLAKLQPALRRAHRGAIVEILRQLLALPAPLGEQWQQIAYIAADKGEVALARKAMDLFVDNAGNTPVAKYQKAGLLAHMGLWQEVVTQLDALPAQVPDPATHAYSRGVAALYTGDREEARERLSFVLEQQPLWGAAWQSLSMLVDFANETELAERIFDTARQAGRMAPHDRAQFFHALGKAHADRDKHAEAFKAFSRAAALLKAEMPHDPARDARIAYEATLGYDAEAIRKIAERQTEPTGRTIFVTGLPRSGTTLVEQILASHSKVADGGEINRLGLLVNEVDGISQAALDRYVEAHGAEGAAQLWNRWMEERFATPGRVIDKTTNTSRMLGLAASLLPEAPIIWVHRDPFDCAWSCFRTYFGTSQKWSNDLAQIADHFRLEDALRTQWQEILGEKLLVVPYASLVAQPREWIGEILAHCGLDDEPGPYAPHDNRRAVATSSALQVREPINRKGIGSAEPYRAFMEPFEKAYST